MNTLVLRPTSIIQYEKCGAAYRYENVLQIRSRATSHALALGTAGHRAVLPYVAAHARGEVIDPVPLFQQAWQEQLDNKVVQFSSRDAKQLLSIGTLLAKQFPKAWDDTGLKAAVGGQRILVENRLKVRLSDRLELTGEPDIVATRANDPDGDLVIPDVKFPSSAAFGGFAKVSEQLTAYQTLLTFHLPRLGLKGRKVCQVGFLQGIKKVGAVWAPPEMAAARSQHEMGEYLSKVQMTAGLIENGYFPKRPGASYRSPCDQCDFKNLCMDRDASGLTSRLGDVVELAMTPHEQFVKAGTGLPSRVAA